MKLWEKQQFYPSVEQAQQAAPALLTFAATQFVIGEPDHCQIITLMGGWVHPPNRINRQSVLAFRSYTAPGIPNAQEGWQTRDAKSIS